MKFSDDITATELKKNLLPHDILKLVSGESNLLSNILRLGLDYNIFTLGFYLKYFRPETLITLIVHRNKTCEVIFFTSSFP